MMRGILGSCAPKKKRGRIRCLIGMLAAFYAKQSMKVVLASA
jgi:hypothetical protein